MIWSWPVEFFIPWLALPPIDFEKLLGLEDDSLNGPEIIPYYDEETKNSNEIETKGNVHIGKKQMVVKLAASK